jgi:aminoglycoside phosphotransferase (APT) family kinase protein
VVHGFSDMLGVHSFLMERLPGTSLSHQYSPSHHAIVPAYARAVATVSSIAVAPSGWLRTNLIARTMAHDIAWSEEKSRRFASEPMRDYTLGWLREHRPPSRPLVMSHGDPNPGNCLVLEDRITGIVDWEFACLTDDPLGALLRVTWLYQAESLRPAFCEAMQRDVDDLNWHVVVSLFRAVFVSGGAERAALAALLAPMIGYSGGV